MSTAAAVPLPNGTAAPRRAALVTGASEGIGRAAAVELARHGYDVAVTELALEPLAGTLGAIEAAGGCAVGVRLDLCSEDSIGRAFAEALEGLGRPLDLLVNNAGRALARSAIDVSWSDWDAVMDVNLKGTFFLTARFGRHCLEDGRPGAVVSVASTHGLTGIPDRAVYGISKGGIVQMTRLLAIEWAAHGVRVNAVAPGTVLTPSRERMLADPARRQRMQDRIPIGRFPTAEEVAAAIRYLAGPEAGAVTGQILPVDGGLTAA